MAVCSQNLGCLMFAFMFHQQFALKFKSLTEYKSEIGILANDLLNKSTYFQAQKSKILFSFVVSYIV